jgi:phosphoglycolate phosphatase
MIGDTTHDMEMARAAGTRRLGVTYGAHARDALLGCEPVTCVDDFEGVRQWLARHA